MADVDGNGNSQNVGWTNFEPYELPQIAQDVAEILLTLRSKFLALLIVCGLLSIFFLLYFNRVFASAVSYIIRAYTWHRYRIYIDIQALQVSLLGGRVFFTGFRYHGDNETILIQNGHITWSYWLWRVRDVDLGVSKEVENNGSGDTENPSNGDNKSAKLPCRINVAVSGLEWFVYNRSPVYESILAGITESVEVDEKIADQSTENHTRQRLQKTSQKVEEQLNKLDSKLSGNEKVSSDHGREGSAPDGHKLQETRSTSLSNDEQGKKPSDDELPLMLQLLPIHFECDKAAVAMGNENTKAILIIKSKSLSGDVDASGCQTPDPYRQIFTIRFDQPVVEMKENEDFKEEQLTKAVKDKQAALKSGPAQHRPFFRRQRRKVMGQLRNLVPYWRKSVESFSVHSGYADVPVEEQLPGSNHWQGLSRYLNDDDEDDKLRWSSVEYAAVPTLVDSPEAVLTIFWDVPGKVTQNHHALSASEREQKVNINGDESPAWAINLLVKGGVINYGPWADRHRAEIQRIFNPSLCKDATPAENLPVGADRVPTQFKFYLETDQEVTLRIPTREDSKNWKWKKEVAELRQHRKHERRRGKARSGEKIATSAAQQRPYGWLDVKVSRNATVSYSMDMMAGPNGYSNTLKVDLPSTEISTSVNHGLLLKSGPLRTSCDMSAPLKWNTLRSWIFDVESDELELFILRDHIFLLIDLIDDWGSGPPQDYMFFVPFKYLLNFQLRNLKLYLNVNDVNIINSPTDFEENAFLIVSSPCLKADTCVGLDVYRPDKNAVPFNVQAEAVAFALHIPPWNTQETFLTCKKIGLLESLTLDGKYHYNSTTSSTNTDTLVLNVNGQSPMANLHGFLIRYFLQLKDNYFGEHIHFKTLDEYQEMLRLKETNPEAEAASHPPHKKSNEMDVILSIRLDDPKILLPANIYTSKRHVTIEGASLGVDLRFTNYYMDLELSLSPLSLALGSDDDGATSPMSAISSTQMFIDGLGLYGHRLFGLPPTEPTYLCNWDLSLGTVTGECTADFLNALVHGGKAFGFSLDDDENALIPYSSIIVYDVTFLRVSIKAIQLWLHLEEAAFLFSTGPIDVNYNDWARTHYSRRANIKVPDLQIACVNSESAARHKSRLHTQVDTDALLRTSIDFALIGRKYDFSRERKIQQELIRREDQRTNRTEFLLLPGLVEDFVPDAVDTPAQSVPSVPQPAATTPRVDEKKSMFSIASSHKSRRVRNKSSFLSFPSDNSSIKRQGSLEASRRPRDNDRKFSNPGPQSANETKPRRHERNYSASTGRHSAFYSAYGDYNDRRDMSHNTVAFSSQFFAPYFPLDNVRPDTKESIIQSIEVDEDSVPKSSQFGLDDVDPGALSQNSEHQSFLIELPTGVSAFLNTASLRHIASLMRALQPSEPVDILDTLQTGAMSEIFNTQKRKKVPGSIKDFVVRIPHAHIRFLNCSDIDSPDPSQEQDQYDVSISKMALAARSEERDDGRDGGMDAHSPSTSRTSFHFRLDSAEASASERLSHLEETQAAVKAKLEKIMISLGSKEVIYIDIDVGSLRATTSSGKVEYLASLIHRTNLLASEMETLFSSTMKKGDQRIKHFTYRLMTESHMISDPSFIVRPSAVLRAANEHLRTYDSWKLAARLRQVWSALGEQEKEQLRLECFGTSSKTPEDARQVVTKAFQKWRGWDLDNIRDAILMNNIFGRSSEVKRRDAGQAPLMAVARIKETAFVLDPGPKQNQIFAIDVTARMQANTTEARDNAERNAKDPLSMINLYCADGGINLNWELLELVEDIFRLYKRSESPEKTPSVDKPPQPAIPEKPSSLHFVFALGRGSIALETVNLRSDTQSTDLKLSISMSKQPQGLTDTNAILACDAVTTKLRSHQQSLTTLRLKGASVFVSHELQLDSHTATHTIKTTASSQDLRLVVKQDPILLTEVLDMLVKDEAAQLYQLQKQLPTSTQTRPQKPKMTEGLSSFRVNLAMFLNTYTISVPLLRSLTYTISGVVARAAMAANSGTEIIFDFDIKENSHDIQIRVNDTPRSISLLQIPPTNGRITSQVSQGEQSISVFASVELIQLDASAVYSLLAALNRPEMSTAINDLQQQVKVVQENVDELFGSGSREKKPPSPTKSDSKRLVYVIHTTLAGIEIFGHAPIKSSSEPYAHLSFCLDSIRFELANRLDVRGPVLENPEFHINLRQIMFDIRKGSMESMRSAGNLSFGALITGTTKEADDGAEQRFFDFKSEGFEVNLSADTVSTLIDVLGYMGDKIKDLDTTREIEYLQRRLRQSRPRIAINDEEEEETENDIFDSFFSSIMYSLEIRNIQISWLVAPGLEHTAGQEDLVLSFQRIEFATKKKNTAKLTVENFQLQMVPPEHDKALRSSNSALLPEVILNIAYVSTWDTRRLAFQAVGKSLDLRLTSSFIVPAANLTDSIGLSIKNVQQASEHWTPIVVPEKPNDKPVENRQRSMFGRKRLESLLVDADFAGAVVYLSSKKSSPDLDDHSASWANRPALAGKYGQFNADDSGGSTVLRTPGLAWKIEYKDDGKEDPAVFGEIKVDASRNILYPTVVPLIMDISSSVKEVVSSDDQPTLTKSATPPSSQSSKAKAKSAEEENILTTDPSAVLGKTKLNLGLRICKQEFTLSCQPIARVAASTCFEDIYITVNTVHSVDHGNFFAISGTFSNLQTSVQHVYSREHTGRFEVDSIELSVMNSKHVSGISGFSAILKVSPMKVDINAKQLQDFLLFREIWVPQEIRQGSDAPVAKRVTEPTSQGHLVQRYQQVAATAAFPWTATISITALDVSVDLGQSLGKSVFAITDFWISSKKTSDWEQNLCLGFQRIGVDCIGRLSGFVSLEAFKLRTSIEWPEREAALNETPRIQASIGFSQFRLKAAFDYQLFLVADITSMDFLMYNVRSRKEGAGDRLVASFDGDAVQVFGTTNSAAQGVALWQAIQRLIQERRASYESSLRDIEKFMKRKSIANQGLALHITPPKSEEIAAVAKSPISLDTDVVVTLKALNLGVFPSTFSDHQVFKLEALNAQARFAASMEQRIHSILGLTLGQLRIGLAGVRHIEAPKAVSEISVEDVVASATGSRGGTILKVPKVEAIMQTWQEPESRSIDYIFKSAFEGKVEVGWNYSRISYIRGMWAQHNKSLAATWGRELPNMSTIKVTGVPEPPEESSDGKKDGKGKEQRKITAEVNVPQSKYEYVPLEPPIIETPQLRDMGEATPPLEWIGLHRERLPNLTHQIVIVSLLELAGEVEDAYGRILGF